MQHVVTRREERSAGQNIAREAHVVRFSLLHASFKLLQLLFELHGLLLFSFEVILQLLIGCLQLKHASIELDL